MTSIAAAAFDRLVEIGFLGALDIEFARMVARARLLAVGAGTAELAQGLVELAAALATRAVAQGHVCVDLARLVQDPPVGADTLPVTDFVWPPIDAWLATLRGDAAVVSIDGPRAEAEESQDPRLGADDYAGAPMVLSGTRLYLERYYIYEGTVVSSAVGFSLEQEPVDTATLAAGVARLFPGADPREQQQVNAASTAAGSKLSIVSGGPGTGKTRTVARILALIVEQWQVANRGNPRIELLAPTGKAAQRLAESIAANLVTGMDCTPEVLAAIPTRASTIHRRLGFLPATPTRFKHNRDNPLVADVVLVDEASMVDVALMAKLVEAVPARARLILLGDRDQLASVEAGAIYGDLCFAAHEFPALARCATHLEHSFRTESGRRLQDLARAIRDGDADATLRLFGEADVGARRVELRAGAPVTEAFIDEVAEGFAALLAATDPAAALARLNDFRILCAHRQGRLGAVRVGAAVERALVERGLLAAGAEVGGAAVGRPVMVTQNDYQLELFNGDVGVTLLDAATMRPRVWFPSLEAGGPLRSFPPSRLPPTEPCFAMTVHKSQGSEFDRVVVVMPERPSPVCTRELLYTAVTRARRGVTVVAAEAVIRESVTRRIARASGLSDRMRQLYAQLDALTEAGAGEG